MEYEDEILQKQKLILGQKFDLTKTSLIES